MRRKHVALALAALLMLSSGSGGCATLKPQARAVAQDAQPYVSWLDSAQAALTAVSAVVAPLLGPETQAATSAGLTVLADAISGLKAASASARAEDASQQWQRGVEAASRVRQALVDAGINGI